MIEPRAEDNPLLTLVAHEPIRFDHIRADHVEPAIRALIAEAQARLDAITTSSVVPRSYDGTLLALEQATERLEFAMSIVEHLESVRTTPELRTALERVQPDVSAFFSGIPLSAPLWSALKNFAATNEAHALSGARKRFLDKLVIDFRRSGADLDETKKARLSAIDVELSELTLKFSQNVLDATNRFELIVADRTALAGLPEASDDAARESAAAKGVEGFRFTLQGPSYLAAMTYLDDASIRERLYRASSTRASGGELNNAPLIERIVALRAEKAALLGYASFADLVCDDRMAQSGRAARDFVSTLRDRTRASFTRENEALSAYRTELDPSASSVAPWDVAYLAEKLRKARHDFDEEELRPYFALDRVLEGAFTVASRLYGIRVEPRPDIPTWHQDVHAYAILEASGETSAIFYADLFPREDKRDGAWMHGLAANIEPGRTDRFHVGLIAANFTPPTAGRPSLLTLREVETLFHEFGHLLHHASSRVGVRSLAGTNVAHDFVELPSQIMENWCWEREALNLFALHYVTGEALPQALFERMRGARAFRAANAMMRQLGFAELDLALHMDAPKSNLVALARSIQADFSPTALPDDYAMVCGFSHLFASPVGYAAGYYAYKWAEVLDADAFSRFAEEGIFDPRVGRDFRDIILAQGGAEDPMDLYRRFRGREPTLDALMRRSGLAA